MPIVEVTLFSGRGNRKKEELIKELTACISRVLSIPKSEVVTILREVERSNISIGGKVASVESKSKER